MKYDLSIIIPMYNCRQYIGDCLNSIFMQRDAAFHQVIVVDDGSTDGSPDIVRQYQAVFSNLELISLRHSGVSVARNAGIDAARGEYINFVDADDMVGVDAAIIPQYTQQLLHTTKLENMFHSLYKMPVDGVRLRFENMYFARMLDAAHKYDTDMVIAGCFTVDSTNGMTGYNSYDAACPNVPVSYDPDMFRFVAINQCSILDNANYQLYRRDMLMRHNLRFTPGMQLNEDLLFAMQAALRANTITTVTESTYLYRRHSGSLTNTNGRYPGVDKISPTQVYISAVILSDLRNLGYRHAYNLFQHQQALAFQGLPDAGNVPLCYNCKNTLCENCARDPGVWAQIQKNLVAYRPTER